MRRKERVTGNALDAVIQIISLAIVENNLATKIKSPLLEVIRAIAKMTSKTKLTMNLVSWLNRQMSPPTKLSPLVDDDVGEEESIINNTKVVNNNNEEDKSIEVDEVVNIKEFKNHPLDQVIGNLNQGTLRSQAQDHNEIFFNKSKYIKKMLKKYWLEDSKPTKTPMSTKIKLTKDDEANSVDSSKYQGMIGSLLYLTASRQDIMFSVCLCARFQENPKTAHLEAVKPIFRYVRATTHLGLWYPKGIRVETVVYADSEHAGDYVDRKSTSVICTFMGCCLTSWFTKKQTALAISTTKSEYVSAKKACQQAL
nr:uncharacterized mitochondrial protein AtMg00810-like [Tanacetum cinerariifolium]